METGKINNFSEYYNKLGDKFMLVVLNEHTLGYIRQSSLHVPGFYTVNILSASIIKGAIKHEGDVPFTEGIDSIRLATEKDFDNFRHSFKGYKNDPQYIYQPTYTISDYLDDILECGEYEYIDCDEHGDYYASDDYIEDDQIIE